MVIFSLTARIVVDEIPQDLLKKAIKENDFERVKIIASKNIGILESMACFSKVFPDKTDYLLVHSKNDIEELAIDLTGRKILIVVSEYMTGLKLRQVFEYLFFKNLKILEMEGLKNG